MNSGKQQRHVRNVFVMFAEKTNVLCSGTGGIKHAHITYLQAAYITCICLTQSDNSDTNASDGRGFA